MILILGERSETITSEKIRKHYVPPPLTVTWEKQYSDMFCVSFAASEHETTWTRLYM